MKRLKGYSSPEKKEEAEKNAWEQLAAAKAKYGDLDESGLMRQLAEIVGEQKQNGTFDAEKVTALVEAAKPYLSENQLKFLCEIIK